MSLQKYEIGEAVSKFPAEKMLFAHVFFVLLLFGLESAAFPDDIRQQSAVRSANGMLFRHIAWHNAERSDSISESDPSLCCKMMCMYRRAILFHHHFANGAVAHLDNVQTVL